MTQPASSVRAMDNGDVNDAAADAAGNRNPIKHRILKTACLYVSFGGMVSLSVTYDFIIHVMLWLARM